MSKNHKHNTPEQENPATEQPQEEILDNVPEAAGEDETAEDIENAEMTEIDRLAQENGELKAQLEKEKKEYLFLMAEFDNFRKRSLKEKSEILRNGAENVMRGLLPIIDDFERGIEAARKTDDPDAVLQGMELIYNKLMKYLEQNGVKPAETTGKPFDPDTQEAIAMVPVADESQKGMVIDTPTKGYTINDKVLRHAKVVVGQ